MSVQSSIKIAQKDEPRHRSDSLNSNIHSSDDDEHFVTEQMMQSATFNPEEAESKNYRSSELR